MEMPIYNLPSKILCKVVHVQLKVPDHVTHTHAFRLVFIDCKTVKALMCIYIYVLLIFGFLSCLSIWYPRLKLTQMRCLHKLLCFQRQRFAN